MEHFALSGRREFYLEYGNFDFTIDAPSNMLVVASGELLNPQQLLSAQELQPLQKSKQSNSTVSVRTVDDVLHFKPSNKNIQYGILQLVMQEMLCGLHHLFSFGMLQELT